MSQIKFALLAIISIGIISSSKIAAAEPSGDNLQPFIMNDDNSKSINENNKKSNNLDNKVSYENIGEDEIAEPTFSSNFDPIDPIDLDRLNSDLILRRFIFNWAGKEKRNDDIPPGFIGVRGRRSKHFGSSYPLIWSPTNDPRSHLRFVPQLPSSLSTPFSLPFISNQKKNNPSIYNDGFLGVRG